MTKARVMLACLGVAVAVLLVNSSSVIATSSKFCSPSDPGSNCDNAQPSAQAVRAASAGGAITTLMAIMDAVKNQCHAVSLQYANGQIEPNASSLHSCIQTQRGTNTVSMCSLLFVAANDACKNVHGGIFDSDNDECQENFIESANAFPVWAEENGYCGWY